MPDLFVSKPKEVPLVEKKNIKTSKNRVGFFSGFSLYPDKVNFETIHEGEKVILFLRQHLIVNVKWILIALVMFFIPGVVKTFGVFDSVPDGFELVITMAWYLFTMAYALENFLNWYFNVYIVTNERIIDVDFHNLIYKSVSDATLDNIQDVTYNMGGVTRTIFNYGDILIQTASEVANFEFMAVPNPARVSKIINKLATKEGSSL